MRYTIAVADLTLHATETSDGHFVECTYNGVDLPRVGPITEAECGNIAAALLTDDGPGEAFINAFPNAA